MFKAACQPPSDVNLSQLLGEFTVWRGPYPHPHMSCLRPSVWVLLLRHQGPTQGSHGPSEWHFPRGNGTALLPGGVNT